jgi:hypothetical protein
MERSADRPLNRSAVTTVARILVARELIVVKASGGRT